MECSIGYKMLSVLRKYFQFSRIRVSTKDDEADNTDDVDEH